MPECRSPEPCGCWGCVSVWVEKQAEVEIVGGVEGDGECD
jgi:hypothetical protein